MNSNVLFVLGTFLLFGCAHSQRKEPVAELNFPLIDAHIHLHPTEGIPDAAKEFAAQFSANHVVGAVVHSEVGELPPNNPLSSIPLKVCAAIRPPVKAATVERLLREGRCHCLKIYLGYVPKYSYDPYYQPFYRLAEKYDVPVVFHTGDTFDKKAKIKYADPLTVDEIAIDFPKVTFVIAHMGNPWFNSAAEVVYKNDNVYADTSGILLGDVAKANPETVQETMIKQVHWFYLYVENPKKILFGTDWPLANPQGSYVEAIKKAIPPSEWENVFYLNAARVFKFKVQSEKVTKLDSPRSTDLRK
jgi:uncharacterized protein